MNGRDGGTALAEGATAAEAAKASDLTTRGVQSRRQRNHSKSTATADTTHSAARKTCIYTSHPPQRQVPRVTILTQLCHFRVGRVCRIPGTG